MIRERLLQGIHDLEMDHLSGAHAEDYNRGWDDALCSVETIVNEVFREEDGRGIGEGPVDDDPVNHPGHYCDGGIETLDYILAKKMDFLLGQVCKYISRAGKKDPAKELEDLQKAEFYLKRKIEITGGNVK